MSEGIRRPDWKARFLARIFSAIPTWLGCWLVWHAEEIYVWLAASAWWVEEDRLGYRLEVSDARGN